MSKQVQKVCNVISNVLVVLVVILALLLVGVRLVGLRPMCVLSGSMEPTYHTGSLIYVKPCAPEDVQVGDAITFEPHRPPGVHHPVSRLCLALGLEPAGDVSGHCDRDRAHRSGVPAGHAAQGG